MLLFRPLSNKTQELVFFEMTASLREPSESAALKQEYPVRTW